MMLVTKTMAKILGKGQLEKKVAEKKDRLGKGQLGIYGSYGL